MKKEQIVVEEGASFTYNLRFDQDTNLVKEISDYLNFEIKVNTVSFLVSVLVFPSIF